MLGTQQETTPPGAAGGRVARRREATKAEILDAAWALVREHGLAALALRDLAARVGMRAPSLYQYFSSKHAIYDAMFAQGTQQALDAITPSLTETETRELLRHIARSMFDFTTSDPARAQLLFQRTIPGFEPSPEAYAPAVEMFSGVQSTLTDHGFTDPDAMDIWTAIISGLTNQQLANDPSGDRWGRLVDRMVDMFIADMASDTQPPKTKVTPKTRPTPKKRAKR
jgi:AcrR family transcriptional regulator